MHSIRLLVIAALLSTCQPPPQAIPTPLVTTPPAASSSAPTSEQTPPNKYVEGLAFSCVAACQHLEDLGCAEADDEKCAHKCFVVLLTEPDTYDVDCVIDAKSIPSVRKCKRITCPCSGKCLYL
jgi:hypothetical protein